MQKLFPAPTTNVEESTAADSRGLTIEEAYHQPLGSHGRGGRPWVGLCMVSSIDGSTVVDGKSTNLSSANDTGVLLQLRAIADVIIVGAGTVRGEGYGPPKKPGQRIGVVTRSGNVDTSLPLFMSGAGFIITTLSAPVEQHARNVDIVRAGHESVDLSAALGQFNKIHDAPHFVQAEGGAYLNGTLLDADLLDEINVTTSPLCVGGDGPRLSTGAGNLAYRYELAQLVIDDDSFMYSRWLRHAAVS